MNKENNSKSQTNNFLDKLFEKNVFKIHQIELFEINYELSYFRNHRKYKDNVDEFFVFSWIKIKVSYSKQLKLPRQFFADQNAIILGNHYIV